MELTITALSRTLHSQKTRQSTTPQLNLFYSTSEFIAMHLFVLHRIAKCCMAMRHITLYSKIFALLMSPPPKASADLKGAVRLCEPADTELSPFRISDWIKAVISNSSFEPHHKNLQCGIHSPSFIPCIRPTDQSTAIFPKLRSQCFVLSSSSVIIPVEKSIAIEL